MTADMLLTRSFAVLLCIATAYAGYNVCDEMAFNCTEQRSATKYTLSLSSEYYKPGEYINVKVHMAQCPTLDTPSPTSYTLTATSQGREVGEFSYRNNALPKFDTQFCRNKTMVLYKSCDPFPLDLPQNYSWTISDDSLHSSVCFKLTVQTASQPFCELTEVCISVSGSSDYNDTYQSASGSSDDQNADDQYSDDHYGDDQYGDYHYADDHYDDQYSDDHYADETGYDRERHGYDDDHTVDTVDNKCAKDRAKYAHFLRFLQVWLPSCDCRGVYKPLQCYRHNGVTDCWCSSVTGAEVAGSRKQLHCKNPNEFEFKCRRQ